MGTFSFTYSDRSTHRRPGVRAQIERKPQALPVRPVRVLATVRERKLPAASSLHSAIRTTASAATTPRCRAITRPGCTPTILSRAKGTGTAEQALRAFGLSMPGDIRPEHKSLLQSHQADAAVPPVVPAAGSEASPSDRRQAGLLASVTPEDIARLAADLHELGMTPDADESQEVEWSPMTGSSEDPVRMAGLPPPPDSRSAHASPASPDRGRCSTPLARLRRLALRESSPGKPGVMTKDAFTCPTPRPSTNDSEC